MSLVGFRNLVQLDQLLEVREPVGAVGEVCTLQHKYGNYGGVGVDVCVGVSVRVFPKLS